MVKSILFLFLFLSALPSLFSSIVIIEGMSGAGKSSSVVSLYPQLSNKFLVLPELNPEATTQFKNKSKQEQAEDYYLLWLKRMEIVRQSNIRFLFDRSYFGSLAFVYALDRLKKTNLYFPLLEKMQLSFDFQKDFDRIIVLDVDPAISIERRIQGNMSNYWPWNNTSFLSFFREFYLTELPTLTNVPIEYIDTSDLDQLELKSILQDKLGVTQCEEMVSPPQYQKDLLIRYIDNHNLGRLHSNLIFSFGYPSIITETHCIQLDENNIPILLDNNRLEYLLFNMSSKTRIEKVGK